MKMAFILILLSSISWACKQQPKDVPTLPLMEAHVISDTIPYEDLQLVDGDGVIKNFYKHQDTLYNGWAIQYEQANDGIWSYVYAYKDGIVQRLDVYGVNDYQHRFVEMKDGYQYHCVMYHRNGKRYLEQFYDKANNPIAIWKRWYSSGELEWEKNYN